MAHTEFQYATASRQFRLFIFGVLSIFALGSSKNLLADELYIAKCAACHQDDGSGKTEMATPAIAGLDNEYVLRQLQNFHKGIRTFSSDQPMAQGMVTVVKSMSVDDLIDVSEHVAAMPIVDLRQSAQVTSFRGRGLYSTCLSCHGANGQGFPKLGAPRIAHQYAWYLRKQLLVFRSGERGAHEEDEFGRQMYDIAREIDGDDELEIIVNYIVGLGG